MEYGSGQDIVVFDRKQEETAFEFAFKDSLEACAYITTTTGVIHGDLTDELSGVIAYSTNRTLSNEKSNLNGDAKKKEKECIDHTQGLTSEL